MTSHDLIPFQELVRQRCGLQFEAMAKSSLALAVQKRMAATLAQVSVAYYARLLGDENEFNELVSLLTINETYFYREPRQLDLLINHLLPEQLAKGACLPLRILSAGCSTGEEPYSIAIAVLEKFGESARQMVKIVAGDIDQHALRRARHAHYNEYSFRGMPPALRQRYFTHEPGLGFQLDPQVRTMVEFHSLNLLAPNLPKHFSDFDIVFFRNVSIYFDSLIRQRIQQTLHAAMRDTGRLVLGTAETLANDLGVFHLVEKSGLFYFSKDGKRPSPAPLPVRPQSPPWLNAMSLPPMPVQPRAVSVPAIPPSEVKLAADSVEALRTLVRTKQNAAALEQLRALRAAEPDNIELQLLESYVLLQLRHFAEAAHLAQQVLERNSWSVEAMMLLGFSAKYQEDYDAAIQHFKLAAYTRPDCWPAHFYLGNLWLAAEEAKARREYRTALSQLTTNPDPDGGLRLPLDLPVADIRFLCQRRSTAGSQT